MSGTRMAAKGDIRLKKKDLENSRELVSFLKGKKNQKIVFLLTQRFLMLQFLE